ncbi:MAG: hypothetical protein AAFX99_21960 [Myxococcota bacterium]
MGFIAVGVRFYGIPSVAVDAYHKPVTQVAPGGDHAVRCMCGEGATDVGAIVRIDRVDRVEEGRSRSPWDERALKGADV